MGQPGGCGACFSEQDHIKRNKGRDSEEVLLGFLMDIKWKTYERGVPMGNTDQSCSCLFNCDFDDTMQCIMGQNFKLDVRCANESYNCNDHAYELSCASMGWCSWHDGLMMPA